MSLAEHVIAVISHDPERVALIERSFDRIATTLRVAHVEDAAGAMQLAPLSNCANVQERPLPHLIVVDDWPSDHSREALQQIRAAETLADARIIVLCREGSEREIAQAYALGANSCLTVSADPEAFVEVMREAGRYWLQLNRWPTW